MNTFTKSAATTGVISMGWSPAELATNDLEEDRAEVEYEDAIEAFAEEFGLTEKQAWELHWEINDGTANIDALYEVMEAQEMRIAA